MTSTTTSLSTPWLAGLGGPELLIILAVLVLLFGAAKLPELARGTGQALRIFKAETKGLTDSHDTATKSDIGEQPVTPAAVTHRPDETAARG